MYIVVVIHFCIVVARVTAGVMITRTDAHDIVITGVDSDDYFAGDYAYADVIYTINIIVYVVLLCVDVAIIYCCTYYCHYYYYYYCKYLCCYYCYYYNCCSICCFIVVAICCDSVRTFSCYVVVVVVDYIFPLL